jgi:hypothetical protein
MLVPYFYSYISVFMNSVRKYRFLVEPLKPLNTVMDTKICKTCRKHPVTVNYVRKGKKYYRSQCYHCIKEQKQKKKQPIQLLKKSGYKKKTTCDRCSFNSKIPTQMSIHYNDGNNYNVALSNLRTYCSNCSIEIKANPAARKTDIIADF